MRLFLRSLHTHGEIDEDFSEKLPKIHNATHQTRLPSSFTSKEVERLLSSVDRNSPVGKRNYAILLLAARLGLRSGDIRDLKFEHIDWENNVIRKTQKKTGEPISLPLLPEIGWALIDYIKYGRPVCDLPEIFVRQIAPHVPMRYYDSMLVRQLQKAGIPTDRPRHHGMHTLRHSLATALLEQHTFAVHTLDNWVQVGKDIYVCLPILSMYLGHKNLLATQQYLRLTPESYPTLLGAFSKHFGGVFPEVRYDKN